MFQWWVWLGSMLARWLPRRVVAVSLPDYLNADLLDVHAMHRAFHAFTMAHMQENGGYADHPSSDDSFAMWKRWECGTRVAAERLATAWNGVPIDPVIIRMAGRYARSHNSVMPGDLDRIAESET